MKFYKVFNVSQCDGVEPIIEDSVEDTITNEPNAIAESVVANYVSKQNGFRITHGGNGAYYVPLEDFVNMPRLESFTDADSLLQGDVPRIGSLYGSCPHGSIGRR